MQEPGIGWAFAYVSILVNWVKLLCHMRRFIFVAEAFAFLVVVVRMGWFWE
jgi:hypothetical protein